MPSSKEVISHHSHSSVRRPLAAAVALIAASTLAAGTHAQGSGILEEVMVTAQKREQSVQDLPISVTAFSGESMRALGFTNSIQLAATNPRPANGSDFRRRQHPHYQYSRRWPDRLFRT